MPTFFRLLTGRDGFMDGRRLAFTVEEAVARMTSKPARRFGLVGRGTLERGAFADIAVWRPEEFRSAATYERPHAFAQGVRGVFVNGALSYEDGRFTHAGAGRFLERRKAG